MSLSTEEKKEKAMQELRLIRMQSQAAISSQNGSVVALEKMIIRLRLATKGQKIAVNSKPG